jgi:hypothetical protein
MDSTTTTISRGVQAATTSTTRRVENFVDLGEDGMLFASFYVKKKEIPMDEKFKQ